MGPWSHGQWGTSGARSMGNIDFGAKTSDWYQENIEIPFFNYYLKGKGNIDKIREANIFISGENKWTGFDQWPPANAADRSIRHGSSGSGIFRPPLMRVPPETLSDAWNNSTKGVSVSSRK